jgi:eukaryotic-like serine/threonine-protein kinase
VLIALYDGKPVPKVIDFGVAKATSQKLTERTLFTEIGNLIGTLEYMAPEQAEVNNLDIDTRADVYSLGVLLYELLAGSPPFTGKQLRSAAFVEMLRIIREVEPPKPSTKLSSSEDLPSISAKRKLEPKRLTKLIKGDLDWIAMKCLEKDRGRRYETANGLAMDLQRYLADEPVYASPPSMRYRLGKFARKYRKPVLAVGLIFLALIGGFAGTSIGLGRAIKAEGDALEAEGVANRERQAADQERNSAREEARKAEQSRIQALDSLCEAYLAQAQAGRASTRPGRRFDSLAAISKAAAIHPSLELRNEAIACMALPDIRVGKSWEGYPAGSAGIVFDSRLERYARSDALGNITIRRVADDQELVLLPGTGKPVWLLRFSSDGRFLSIRVDDVISRIWDIERQLVLKEFRPSVVDFSPDSTRVAVAFSEEIEIWELPSCKFIKLVEKSPHWPYAMAFSPDGRQLATCTLAPLCAVEVRDVQSGNVIATLSHSGGARAISWRRDGSLLAAACGDFKVCIWDTENWREIAALEGHESEPIEVSFSNHGHLLASTAWDGTVRLWEPLAKKLLVTAQGGIPFGFPKCQFSADDCHLSMGLAVTKVWLWDVATALECRSLFAHRARRKGPRNVDISPDNRFLVSANDDGLRLWDLATSREVAHLFQSGQRAESVFFLPSGQEMISHSEHGVQRWPIIPDPDNRMHCLPVGPPQDIIKLGPANSYQSRASLNGEQIASFDQVHSCIILLDRSGVNETRSVNTENLNHTNDRMSLSLSPNARWIATYGHWDIRGTLSVRASATGEIVMNSVGSYALGEFSRDGRWLATGGEMLQLWDTQTWKVAKASRSRPELGQPGASVFTYDSRMLAVIYSSQVIRLLDPDSGDEIATFTDPLGRLFHSLAFSRDGTLLAVAGNNNLTQVWDLRKIRAQLNELGLDWQGSPIPPTSKEINRQPSTVPVAEPRKETAQEVLAKLGRKIAERPNDADLYHRRGRTYAILGEWNKVAADFATALELLPSDAADNDTPEIWRERFNLCLELAQWDKAFEQVAQSRPNDWRVCVGRGTYCARRSEWEEAVHHYAKAVELMPNVHWLWYYYAYLRLQVGDAEGYRQACKSALERFKNTGSGGIAHRVALVSLAAPGENDNLKIAMQLAEKSVRDYPRDGWHLLTLALAHHRAGQFEKAVERLEQVFQTPMPIWGRLAAKFLSAMAHHRLGHADEARRRLKLAANALAKTQFKDVSGEMVESFQDYILCQQLAREARVLIEE